MAELTTVARPYARAAFEYANARRGGLKRWSEMLMESAQVASERSMRTLLASPAQSAEEKAELLLDICGNDFTKAGSNFIKLLAENQRLNLLPEISRVFEALRAEAEKTIEAEMISAFPVDDAERDNIVAALSKKLNRDVVLNCTVDESMLGGAIIRAGDLVIDGSVQGKLAKLAAALRQ